MLPSSVSYFHNARDLQIQDSTFIGVGGNWIQNQYVGGSQESSISQQGIEKLAKMVSFKAMHTAYRDVDPPKCHPKTRTVINSQILTWIKARGDIIHGTYVDSEQGNNGSVSHSREILWLHGPAGAGKSAIAQTLSEEFSKKKWLAASFFFSRGNGSRGFSRYIFTTIAYQLAMALPERFDAIGKVVAHNPAILSESLEIQLQKLIIEPICSTEPPTNDANTEGISSPAPFVIIIDGLDECDNDKHQCAIVNYISDMVHTHHMPFTFILTSRPEPHIRYLFENHSTTSKISYSLFLEESYKDLAIFLRDGFRQLRETYYQHTTVVIDPAWPSDRDIHTLIQRSSGYFIYASTVLKFLDDPDSSPVDQLKLVMSGSPKPFTELDDLYRQILRRVPGPNGTLLSILVGVCQYNASISKIALVIGVQEDTISITLCRLHSLLKFTGNPNTEQKIYVSHASFRDFLFSADRSREFHLNSQIYRTILLGFIQRTQRNILDQEYVPWFSLYTDRLSILHGITDEEDQDIIVSGLREICDVLVSEADQKCDRGPGGLSSDCFKEHVQCATTHAGVWAENLATALYKFQRCYSHLHCKGMPRRHSSSTPQMITCGLPREQPCRWPGGRIPISEQPRGEYLPPDDEQKRRDMEYRDHLKSQFPEYKKEAPL